MNSASGVVAFFDMVLHLLGRQLNHACGGVLLLLLVSGACVCRAQTIEVHPGAGPTVIDGPWTVTVEGAHSSRQLDGVRLNQPLRGQGPVRVMWFRTKLKTDGTVKDPALMVAPRAAGCQIYVNGVKAGDCLQGGRPAYRALRGLVVPLKPDQTTWDVAIRLERPVLLTEDGSELNLGLGAMEGLRGVQFGARSVLVDHRAARDLRFLLNFLPQILLCLAELLGGALLFLVFAFDRRNREYLWFGIFLWLDGSGSLNSVLSGLYPLMPMWGSEILAFIAVLLRYVPLIEFLAAFTGARVNRWVRAYEVVLVLWVLASVGGLVLDHVSGLPGHSVPLVQLLVAQLPFDIGSLVYLVWRWRHGECSAGMLLPSFLLANGIELLWLTLPVFGQRFYVGPFSVSFDDLSMFFFLLSIGPVIFWRYRQVTQEYARTAAELDAGREIQQQLVPQTLPEVAGCSLAAVYLPAAEVGGDFYQVFPEKDGAALLVVGDVSGKGLKAAMRGTLAIGALRNMTQEELQPSEILMRLNRQLAASPDGGFITGLCARITPNGGMTVANAGHLSPYRNGEEMEMESGLPLGITEAAEYTEKTVQLAPGDTLTFLSDGVIEARAASGELFGFERTRAISGQKAEEIAQAAQAFGQEDDITVLTLTLAGSRV